MSEAAQVGALKPTQDERTMAVLAHALQMVGWWIAPLIIFLLRRQSRFVSFHALQALLLQVAYFLFAMALMVVWFVVIFSQVFQASSGQHPAAPPPMLFLVFPLIWLFFMGCWVMMLILSILYSIKAGRGEWAEYPLLGPLARRVLKIGPGGAVLQA